MKYLLSSILLIFLSSIKGYAQIETRYYPNRDALNGIFEGIQTKSVNHLPAFDLSVLQKEDAELDGSDVPYRFGKGFDVSFSLSDGEWQDIDDGRIWSMTFESSGAISLNFIFNEVYLPEGGYIYVVNKEQTVLYGPVFERNLGKKGLLMTDIIPGDCVTILLFEPYDKSGESRLKIKRIIHGYRSVYENENYGQNGSSAPCNIDVACRPSFEKESKAVGLVLLSSGYEWCSGSLVMTTDFSFKPYFLTAFHCIDTDVDGYLSEDEISNAENWMFKFYHKKTECNGSVHTGYTYNSDTFRAGWKNTDFALVEINDVLKYNSNLMWLGWDRTGDVPSSGNCIHHPCGDVMKINTVNTPFNTSSWNGTNNHWYINWDEGVTQGGSSGAPFLNQNKRVVGQNHGKLVNQSMLPVCDRKRSDAGKFHLSWTGNGTNTTRLSNWLDPIGTNTLTMDGYSYYNCTIQGPSVVEGSANYSVQGVPTGCSVVWTVTNNPNNDIGLSQSGNQCTITYNQPNSSVNTTLYALVNYNGNMVMYASKQIQVYMGFSGTYKYSTWTGTINYPNPIWITPGSVVHIYSPNLKNSSVTYTGNVTPTYYLLNTAGGTLDLGLPSVNYATIVLNITSTNGHTYYLPVIASNDYLQLSVSASNGQLTVSLISEDCRDRGSMEQASVTGIDSWTLEVYNVVTGEKKYGTNVRDTSCTIPTVGWKPGIYSVRATIGETVLYEKILIK